MDIPLHPAVVTEMERGRDFLDRIGAARRRIEQARIQVDCPDGDNQIVFDGAGMVVDATFVEDIFDRYRGDELGELLTLMCETGYQRTCEHVTAAVTGVLDEHGSQP
ncbi:MAG TPA: hypothetical protein VMU34_00375 [Mycobacterium sp.]|nr:hypothetical protein [Mycobacterium sp.]